MATECNGLMYFPTKCAFFEGEMPEILEAKHGIEGPCLMIKLLCKIYKERYYIPWGEKQQILTSADIQRVWVEATSRRKRCMDKLPFLLIAPKCKQPEGLTLRNDNNVPTQKDLNFENADISQQSKVEKSKVEERRKQEEEGENTGASSTPGLCTQQANS